MKTDSQIQQDVLRELLWDSRVEETDVGVEVDHGVVNLTGTVPDYSKKVAAQQAAHRVAGVLDVVNDVRVRLPGSVKRSDTDLAHAVRHTLEWDVVVPHDRICSTVSDGWVTLEGEVDTWHERNAAERAIRNLVGTHGVFNKLTVCGEQPASQTIRHEIEAALERRAERHAGRIRVDVQNGTVTLRGVVNSWAEEKAVLGAARHTSGVHRVHNLLDLELGTG